jgi:hypothetical protein
MTDWNAKDPETGELVHVRMGLTEDGQGPADPPDPAFHHWGCWCGDRHCPGPPRWNDLFGIAAEKTAEQLRVSLRPAEPTYTAAEVKVLTETAAEAGRRIGRKEAAESVAAAIAAEIEETDDLPNMYVTGMHRARWIAVNIASLASGAASDATSVPSEGPGTSEPSKAASLPDNCASVHPTASHIPCVKPAEHEGDHVSRNGRNWRQEPT